MDHFSLNPLYILAGLFVGTLVGFTGVGGGSLMTPLLVLLFGFHPASAVGTDLLYASATKAVGTGVHGRKGTVDWSVVGRLAVGSMPAAAITLLILSKVGGQSKETQEIIGFALGIVLLVTSVTVLFRARLVMLLTGLVGDLSTRSATLLTIILGAVLGVLVSLTSVGAGAIGMTALLILYPQHPTNRLVGSDIAHAVPLTLVAGAGHLAMGDVNVPVLLLLLTGSIPGIVIGSLLSARVADHVLRPVLAVTLALVGLKLVL